MLAWHCIACALLLSEPGAVSCDTHAPHACLGLRGLRLLCRCWCRLCWLSCLGRCCLVPPACGEAGEQWIEGSRNWVGCSKVCVLGACSFCTTLLHVQWLNEGCHSNRSHSRRGLGPLVAWRWRPGARPCKFPNRTAVWCHADTANRFWSVAPWRFKQRTWTRCSACLRLDGSRWSLEFTL